MKSKKELWLRMAKYQFEGLVPTSLLAIVQQRFGGENASKKAFAAKVAQKRGWSVQYALRVIEEYKKFVFLGMVCDTNVTPPDPVDKVWHQHILFSKGYREFCANVLQHDFDHKPELLPVETQTELFRQQYAHTLELYRTEFGINPPEDIWGRAKFEEKPLPRTKSSRKVGQQKVPDQPGVAVGFFEELPLCEIMDLVLEFFPTRATTRSESSSAEVIREPDNHSRGNDHDVLPLEKPYQSVEVQVTETISSHDSAVESSSPSCSSCSSSSCGSSCGGGGD